MTSMIALVAASMLWGLAHSYTASLHFKNRLAAKFNARFMRWYRLVYNGFAVVSLAPLFFLTLNLPDTTLYSMPPFWSFTFMLVQALALAFLIIGLLQTDVLSITGLLPFLGRMEEGKERLVTKGLYVYVRHPLYTAGLFLMWFSPRMSANQLTLYLAFTVYIVIGAFFEERKLLRVFGQDYANYKARTPMLIPFIKRTP